MPEGLAVGLMYIWMVFGMVIMANWVTRLFAARWRLGTLGQLAVPFVFVMLLDACFEPYFMRFLGSWTYGGGVGPMLYKGHYYQLPLHEVFFTGLVFVFWTAMRYFKNDKGQTLAERGIDRVRAEGANGQGCVSWRSLGSRTWAILLGYNIPTQILFTHAAPSPEDILKRSYFTAGLCGTEVLTPRQAEERNVRWGGIHCPDQTIPMPRGNGSGYVDADGTFVGPSPREVRPHTPYWTAPQ